MNIYNFYADELKSTQSKFKEKLKEFKNELDSLKTKDPENWEKNKQKLLNIKGNTTLLLKGMTATVSNEFLKKLCSAGKGNKKIITFTSKIEEYFDRIAKINTAIENIYNSPNDPQCFINLCNAINPVDLETGKNQSTDQLNVDEILVEYKKGYESLSYQKKIAVLRVAHNLAVQYEKNIQEEIENIMKLFESFENNNLNGFEEFKLLGSIYIKHIIIGIGINNQAQINSENLKSAAATLQLYIKNLEKEDTRPINEKQAKLDNKFVQYINLLIKKGVININENTCSLYGNFTLHSIIQQASDLLSDEDTVNYNSLKLLNKILMILSNEKTELNKENIDDSVKNINDIVDKAKAEITNNV